MHEASVFDRYASRVTPVIPLSSSRRSHSSAGVGGEDVAVTGIENGDGGAAEQLAASGAEIDCKGG